MIEWFEKYLTHAIIVPCILSASNFGLLLFESLQDGILTDAEMHNLIRNCSGVNMLILMAVIAVMKARKSS